MADRYQAYLEYKQPDIKFVNDIPTHWVISKVRHISTFGRGLAITKANLQDTGIPCVSYGEVHSKFGFEVDPSKHSLKCVSKEYLASSPYALLSKGDIVFADTSEDIDGSGNFTQLVSDETLFAGYHTVIVRPSPANYYRFVAYLFDSPEFRAQVRDAVKGVKVFSVTQAILKNASVWLPSFEEQQKIANFLDHETAKIDTLIAKQEKLIELLKEKRQAVISHAVTKGLNPDVPMKDSGVEWLGEVPEHWSILKFGIINKSAELGGNYNSGEGEEGLPLIKMGNLGRGDISLKKMEYLPIEENFDKAHLLKCGDFLFNTRNSLDLVGKVSIWKNELPKALYNSNVLRISFEPTLVSSSQYMSYLFNSDLGLSQLRLIAKGTTSVAAIYYKELKSISFPLPTLKEQEEIVEYVGKNIGKLDELIKQSQEAIQLIKERKTALISAAVTGKIDVREWVGDRK